MKRFLMGVLVVAGMLIGSLSVQAAPDFSGTWVLDLDKSDLGVKKMPADKHAGDDQKSHQKSFHTSSRLKLSCKAGANGFG